MPDRQRVTKTYKLFIGGKFPRSESGRTLAAIGADGASLHVAHASRKDLRDAAESARKAQPAWADATAYLRGQILYRMAEMLEGRRAEFIDALAATRAEPRPAPQETGRTPRDTFTLEQEVDAAVDRLVCYAGWADKHAQALGCNNPVAGPYYNFTTPEPVGVVGVLCPDPRPLLALISLIAPPLCTGNTIIALGSPANPIPAALLGEVCATSDIPPGVLNILTGLRDELVPHFASHRGIDAIHAADLPDDEATTLRRGVADNLKRITIRRIGTGRDVEQPGWFDEVNCHSPTWIEPFIEFKTVWHPSAT